jgi:hypothetical protein
MAGRNARSITIRVPSKTYEVLTREADGANVTLESFVEARIGDLVAWMGHQNDLDGPAEEVSEIETDVTAAGVYL